MWPLSMGSLKGAMVRHLIFGMGSMLPLLLSAQVDTSASVFGKGIRVVARDSSFYMQFRFRMQPNYTGFYTEGVNGSDGEYIERWSIRRSRLKLDGWAFTTKLVYKFEYDLVGNYIRDAVVKWNFAGNFKLWFGQAKLPGNFQRVVSSQSMQLVDRSLTNNQFNIDRDVGVQLHHTFKVGVSKFNWAACYSQGDGIIYQGPSTGGDITARFEALPLGPFTNKGDQYEADLAREKRLKMLVGATYDRNMHAFQDRGQWGRILDEERDLESWFVDVMAKYRGVFLLLEYAQKHAVNGSPAIVDSSGTVTASFITGSGYNIQGGYLFKSNWEVSGRYSTYEPDARNDRPPRTESTVGVSRYILGHNLKVQMDASVLTELGQPDELRGRLQMELAF
jgi:hypothetical protein